MKLKSLTLTLILIISLFSGTVTATENKDLPTQKELTTFLNETHVSKNYTGIVSQKAVTQHPDWKWDIWQGKNKEKTISFYYAVGNAGGYGSMYIYDNGTKVNSQCKMKNTLIHSYNGTSESVECNVTETPEKQNVTETKISDNKTKDDIVTVSFNKSYLQQVIDAFASFLGSLKIK